MHNELHCNYTLSEALLERRNYREWDGQCSMHAWEWEREKKRNTFEIWFEYVYVSYYFRDQDVFGKIILKW